MSLVILNNKAMAILKPASGNARETIIHHHHACDNTPINEQRGSQKQSYWWYRRHSSANKSELVLYVVTVNLSDEISTLHTTHVMAIDVVGRYKTTKQQKA